MKSSYESAEVACQMKPDLAPEADSNSYIEGHGAMACIVDSYCTGHFLNVQVKVF